MREAANKLYTQPEGRRGQDAPGNPQVKPQGKPMLDGPVDVRGMITEAQRQSPDGHLEGVFYGTGLRAVFTIYMTRGIPGDYSNSDFVYFDQRPGAICTHGTGARTTRWVIGCYGWLRHCTSAHRGGRR
jgi:hypothetical protein